MKHKQVIAASTIALSSFSFAQDTSSETSLPIALDSSLGIIEHIRLDVSDNVSDGCWTNVSAIESRVRSKLLQSDIAVYDEELAYYVGSNAKLFIDGTGYRTQDRCVGMIAYKLMGSSFGRAMDYESQQEWEYPVAAVFTDRGSVASGLNNLNTQFLEAVDEYTDQLISEIYESRRDPKVENARAKLHTNKATTQRRFDEIINDMQ